MVALACLTQKGCSEIAGVYYDQNLELQAIVKRTELKVRVVAGPAIDYAAPIFVFVAGGSGTIKLASHWNLNVSRKTAEVIYTLNF